MKTCKDCVHYDVCHVVMIAGEIHECAETMCKTFKDKSLILNLPCKVGDTVYFIEDGVILKLTIAFAHICFVSDDETYYELIDTETYEGYWDFKNSDIGKTVFFTKESAEQALKEREHI